MLHDPSGGRQRHQAPLGADSADGRPVSASIEKQAKSPSAWTHSIAQPAEGALPASNALSHASQTANHSASEPLGPSASALHSASAAAAAEVLGRLIDCSNSAPQLTRGPSGDSKREQPQLQPPPFGFRRATLLAHHFSLVPSPRKSGALASLDHFSPPPPPPVALGASKFYTAARESILNFR